MAVNLGAIPENLFESEMFGHMKGSFTGADQNKIGLVEAANGGDLFLDEIEVLPLHHQAKLLRFLETGEYRKIGSHQLQVSKLRIISATNRSLPEMIKLGEFREDLYFRLNAHNLELPPLRERPEDIPVLAQWFLQKYRLNKKTFSQEALAALQIYSWPGNVRELKRICEQIALTSPLPVIRAVDVESTLPQPSPYIDRELLHSLDLEWNTPLSLDEKLSKVEAFLIKKAMEKFVDVDLAAQKLGSSRSNLYKKLKEHKIEN
jgi:DNA-binding NtrC family response regulator